MNHIHILLILQVFCLLGFAAGIVSSAEPSENREGCQDPLLASAAETRKTLDDGSDNPTLIDEDLQKEADNLAGTCPKGFHCSCPGCPLYSDLDEDSFCDLGEEEDV